MTRKSISIQEVEYRLLPSFFRERFEITTVNGEVSYELNLVLQLQAVQ